MLVVGFLAVVLAVFSRPASATPFAFTAVVNTAPLVGSALGPFSIDFQLNGVGPLFNDVTIGNFQFGGGMPTGAATLIGGAAGSLGTSVTLSSSGGFLNEFYQEFVPGTTLRFDVFFATVNVNTPPDAFSFSILDGSLANIITNGFADTLLYLNLASPVLQVTDVATAGSITPFGVTAEVGVPEPVSLILLGTGLAACAVRLRRSARSRSTANSKPL
jgi:hypothetical protein